MIRSKDYSKKPINVPATFHRPLIPTRPTSLIHSIMWYSVGGCEAYFHDFNLLYDLPAKYRWSCLPVLGTGRVFKVKANGQYFSTPSTTAGSPHLELDTPLRRVAS